MNFTLGGLVIGLNDKTDSQETSFYQLTALQFNCLKNLIQVLVLENDAHINFNFLIKYSDFQIQNQILTLDYQSQSNPPIPWLQPMDFDLYVPKK